jgi:hypothetical protein
MPEPIGENDEYIEPTDNVINITYYDSSDDEFEDLDDNDDYYTDNEEDEFDEKTSEKRKFLDEYFQEIADIVSYGNSKLKIMFHDKRGVKLVGKDIKCDLTLMKTDIPLYMMAEKVTYSRISS